MTKTANLTALDFSSARCIEPRFGFQHSRSKHAAFMCKIDPNTHYSPCFGFLLSGSFFFSVLKHTHTQTHTLETGCVEAYAQIDSASVCSVQSWCFETSLCLLTDLQHMAWCNMVSAYNIYTYNYISVLSQGVFCTPLVCWGWVFKELWKCLNYSIYSCWCASPGVVTMRIY